MQAAQGGSVFLGLGQCSFTCLGGGAVWRVDGAGSSRGLSPSGWISCLTSTCTFTWICLLQSVLQQRQNQGDGNDEGQTRSILSYLTDCDFDTHQRSKSHSLTLTNEADSFNSEDTKGTETGTSTPASDHKTLSTAVVQDTCAEGGQHQLPNHTTLDILKKTPCVTGVADLPASPLDYGEEGQDSISQGWSHQLGKPENLLAVQRSLNAENDTKPDGSKLIEKPIQEVLNLLKLQNPGQIQLKQLENQVLCIKDKLKVWLYFCSLSYKLFYCPGFIFSPNVTNSSWEHCGGIDAFSVAHSQNVSLTPGTLALLRKSNNTS